MVAGFGTQATISNLKKNLLPLPLYRFKAKMGRRFLQ